MNLDNIATDLIDTMPAISEHAIAEAEDAQERKEYANTTAKTPAGVEYNPETHEISPKTGKVIKKRNRKSESAAPVSRVGKEPDAPPAVEETQARATGKFAASALIAACVGIFGDEFVPEKHEHLDERAYLESAMGDYFVATGRTDLPPNAALCIALGVYIAPRLTRPKTRGKLARLKDFLASKFLGWRAKKSPAVDSQE